MRTDDQRMVCTAVGLLALAACAAPVESIAQPRTFTPLSKLSRGSARGPVVHDPEDLRRGVLEILGVGVGGCEVRIDGAIVGHSPLTDEPITLGRHELALICARGEPIVTSVQIPNEGRVSLVVQLPKAPPGQAAVPVVAQTSVISLGKSRDARGPGPVTGPLVGALADPRRIVAAMGFDAH